MTIICTVTLKENDKKKLVEKKKGEKSEKYKKITYPEIILP